MAFLLRQRRIWQRIGCWVLSAFSLAALTNANTGEPLGGKTLTFSVAGMTVCNATTNSLGYASCKFPLKAFLFALLTGITR